MGHKSSKCSYKNSRVCQQSYSERINYSEGENIDKILFRRAHQKMIPPTVPINRYISVSEMWIFFQKVPKYRLRFTMKFRVKLEVIYVRFVMNKVNQFKIKEPMNAHTRCTYGFCCFEFSNGVCCLIFGVILKFHLNYVKKLIGRNCRSRSYLIYRIRPHIQQEFWLLLKIRLPQIGFCFRFSRRQPTS